MSRIKSLSNNFDSSDCINGDNISPNLDMEYNKILDEIQHQVFFDQDLTHEHLISLVTDRNTIESKLIQMLNDRIHNLNIDCNIRERLIANLNKFSTNFTHINIYSNTYHQQYSINYESDEESYRDYQTDDIDSDNENDYCDDLENLLLDDIEMEHNINGFSYNIQQNQNQNTIDNDNRHNSN